MVRTDDICQLCKAHRFGLDCCFGAVVDLWHIHLEDSASFLSLYQIPVRSVVLPPVTLVKLTEGCTGLCIMSNHYDEFMIIRGWSAPAAYFEFTAYSRTCMYNTEDDVTQMSPTPSLFAFRFFLPP